MKHKHLNYATRNLPGYIPPATYIKTGKGKGSPCQQAFRKPGSK